MTDSSEHSEEGPRVGGDSLACAEEKRLVESRHRTKHWKRWGPYLAERAWGTVREDYSEQGTAWESVSHDHARSKAYRWNEDGLAGICDRHQKLCFALALWNTHDPILKERLFGLTGNEGNHGEDVKEYYYYLDSTPTHSYMKMLYKYPHAAYPYSDLVNGNRDRGREAPELELIDTGVFAENRYFDVFVEYAKADVDDLLVRVRVVNRGATAASLHVLPTLWFRNTWSWGGGEPRPRLWRAEACAGTSVIELDEPTYGQRWLYCEGAPELLFTENETNSERLYGSANPSPYVKDGIGRCVVEGEGGAVNPAQQGTKAAAHHALRLQPGQEVILRLRLTDTALENPLGPRFDAVFAQREAEADLFYESVIPRELSADGQSVMRQAFAG